MGLLFFRDTNYSSFELFILTDPLAVQKVLDIYIMLFNYFQQMIASWSEENMKREIFPASSCSQCTNGILLPAGNLKAKGCRLEELQLELEIEFANSLTCGRLKTHSSSMTICACACGHLPMN